MVAFSMENKGLLKMFSLLDNIRCIVVFVFFILVIQSTTSSPLENDKMVIRILKIEFDFVNLL